MPHVATVNIPAAASALSDFPVLITPTSAAQWNTFWATVVNGGGDIRVYLDDDTTQLAREVVSCNTGTETGEIWVKVPTVSATLTTDIHIYADGSSSEPAAGSTFGSHAVWAGAHAVYHGDTTTDATGNGFDLAAVGGAIDSGTGPWPDSGAWDFSGSNYLFDTAAPVTDEPFSLSGWFNTADVSNPQTLVSLGNDGDNGAWRIFAWGGGSGEPLGVSKQNDAGPGIVTFGTSTGYSANTWHLGHGVFTNNSSRTAYLDAGGAVTNTDSVSDPTPDFISLGVMRRSAGARTIQFLTGLLAHARIWKTALSADWIAYEHANQDDPAGWYTVTDEGGGATVTPDGALHGHISGAPTLTQAHVLAVQGALHGHLAQETQLSLAAALATQDALHAHLAGEASLTQDHALSAQGSLHGHIAGEAALTVAAALDALDAQHGHIAGDAALTQAHVLEALGAVHAHLAAEAQLTVGDVLDVLDSLHAHIAGSPALTQAHALVVAGSLHGHIAQASQLTQAGSLVVQGALHGHLSGEATVTEAAILAVADALHAHLSGSAGITQAHVLAALDALHGHTAGEATLEILGLLNVAGAVHAHLSGEVELTPTGILQALGSVHAHLSGEVIFPSHQVPTHPGMEWTLTRNRLHWTLIRNRTTVH